MPWDAQSFREKHNHSLSPAQAKKAAAQANAILRSTGDDGMAIATANKAANLYKGKTIKGYAKGGMVDDADMPEPGDFSRVTNTPVGTPVRAALQHAWRKVFGAHEPKRLTEEKKSDDTKEASAPTDRGEKAEDRREKPAETKTADAGQDDDKKDRSPVAKAEAKPKPSALSAASEEAQETRSRKKVDKEDAATAAAVRKEADSGTTFDIAAAQKQGATEGGAGRAKGGKIHKVLGKPVGEDDGLIPAQKGEFVVKKDAVDKLGEPALNEINKGKLPRSAKLYGKKKAAGRG